MSTATLPTRNTMRPSASVEFRNLALEGWFLARHGEVSDRHERAAREVGIDLGEPSEHIDLPLLNERELRDLRLRRAERRAMGADSVGPLMGDTIEALELALVDANPFRKLSTIVRTETGGAFVVPRLNDLSTEGQRWGESMTASAADATLSRLRLDSDKYSSRPIILSNQLLRDAPAFFLSILARAIGERIARRQTSHWTDGLLAVVATGNTSAISTAIASDEIIDLEFAIDPDYRESPSAAYMCHSDVAKQLVKLKDGSGQYLYRRRPGEGATLNGYPLVFNRSMPSTLASGTRALFFGDWSKLYVRDVGSVRINATSEAANTGERDATEYCGFIESDGGLAALDAVKALVMA